jgi:hypothetical protein
MKAWMLAAVAVVTFVFAGCTTEPEESFQEIRVDAFSHYWATQKARGAVKPGNRIVVPSLDSNGTGYVDTLVLVKSELDKSAQLPAHSFELHRNPGILVYQVDQEPKEFSCYHDNGGKYLRQSDTATPLFDLRLVVQNFVEGEADETMWAGWYASQEDSETLSPIPCGFAKGKGFYFGYNYGSDPYADYLDRATGTFIIRYR